MAIMEDVHHFSSLSEFDIFNDNFCMIAFVLRWRTSSGRWYLHNRFDRFNDSLTLGLTDFADLFTSSFDDLFTLRCF